MFHPSSSGAPPDVEVDAVVAAVVVVPPLGEDVLVLAPVVGPGQQGDNGVNSNEGCKGFSELTWPPCTCLVWTCWSRQYYSSRPHSSL